MNQKNSYTLEELEKITGATLYGDKNVTIVGVAAIDRAKSDQVTFLANARYADLLEGSAAGAVCVNKEVVRLSGRNYLVSEDPSSTFQRILESFPQEGKESGFKGIHPSAVIHKSAKISPDAEIGPHTVIDKDVVIGKNARIAGLVSIGPSCKIGDDCEIYSHVTIRERSVIGNRVILQPGCVIGSCGFGYVTDIKGKHTKLKQLGFVEIGDDVEIGANTTIDRARFDKTTIGSGTKIDNLVQIGHNVRLGEDNLLVAQVGIAGSSETGRLVIIGGQAAIAGHVKVGSGAQLAARSAAIKDLPPGKYAGAPAVALLDHHRNLTTLMNMGDIIKEMKERLTKLEEKLC